ncbi:hypothetical protein J4711_14020 [Staphylococcus epidermidis]|nr:hypothetical protein [Staphylococcus epidermidis]
MDSAAQMQAQQARDFIAQATLLMRSGTAWWTPVSCRPLSEQPQQALTLASTATALRRGYDRLVLAELAALQSETGVQLSVAEQHLSVAEQQLAALDGISVAIRSLVDAQSVGAKAIAKDQWQTVDGNMVGQALAALLASTPAATLTSGARMAARCWGRRPLHLCAIRQRWGSAQRS